MKIRELIERLHQEDPEAEVLGSDCCYGLSLIETIERDAVVARANFGTLGNPSGRCSVEHLVDWDGEWDTDDDPVPITQAVILR